jgi:hypothetical protein
MPGLFKRKIRVKRAESEEEVTITHLQETKWDDNRAPDHSCEEGVYERIDHIIRKM